jgi:hypothetical protein
LLMTGLVLLKCQQTMCHDASKKTTHLDSLLIQLTAPADSPPERAIADLGC